MTRVEAAREALRLVAEARRIAVAQGLRFDVSDARMDPYRAGTPSILVCTDNETMLIRLSEPDHSDGLITWGLA